ncbi:unnamed protein product, partial [Porites lobata]
QDLSALGVLLNRVDPIKMSTPITRTNFNKQLQCQQLEQQDHLFQTQKPSQPDFSQSQSIAVPRTVLSNNSSSRCSFKCAAGKNPARKSNSLLHPTKTEKA